MATASQTAETITPESQSAVVEAVRAAHDARQPLFPVGGRTCIDKVPLSTLTGRQLDLTQLARIVEYTPRDMTVLVEAGIRMTELAAALAAEGQQLPIDVPRAAEATLGGVVATGWSGPRRLGHGTMRDYVIGIHAVDGRSVAFKGGGRVVKNVAGYDFCKLLTGSMGSIGVVTQLALKVKPLAERALTVVAHCGDLAVAEAILARLVNVEGAPAAIDLLVGAAWKREALPAVDGAGAMVAVRVEGTEVEANWLAEHVQYEFWQGGATGAQLMSDVEAERLWSHQIEFPDRGAGSERDGSPLVVKIAVPPSDVVAIIRDLLAHDAECTVQSHAANGIIVARFASFAHADVSAVLVGKLRPAVIQCGGNLVILECTLDGLTPHIVWGGRTEATILMERIQREFDPHNILNPGRFVFGAP